MEKTSSASVVLHAYQEGQRCFEDIYIRDDSFAGRILEGVIFQNCKLYVDFRDANLRNVRFQKGAIKTCDFRGADLTDAYFADLSVEGTQFSRAKTDGVYWGNNFSYGSESTQVDFDEWIKGHEDSML